MIVNMRAIEYNMLKTMLKLLNDRLPSIANEYNIKNREIPVLPAYPADLTGMKKPSIIVRKVDTRQSKIGLGNVLGQYFNPEVRGYSDVVGKRHDIMVQFDVATASNTERALFESMLSDDLFNKIAFEENGKFSLYDFTEDDENPKEIGIVHLIGDPTVTNVIDKDSTNENYIGAVRHSFAIIQTVIPTQEYVDLSKWIKQTYKIMI
jgi:hypothetical protein